MTSGKDVLPLAFGPTGIRKGPRSVDTWCKHRKLRASTSSIICVSINDMSRMMSRGSGESLPGSGTGQVAIRMLLHPQGEESMPELPVRRRADGSRGSCPAGRFRSGPGRDRTGCAPSMTPCPGMFALLRHGSGSESFHWRGGDGVVRLMMSHDPGTRTMSIRPAGPDRPALRAIPAASLVTG